MTEAPVFDRLEIPDIRAYTARMGDTVKHEIPVSVARAASMCEQAQAHGGLCQVVTILPDN